MENNEMVPAAEQEQTIVPTTDIQGRVDAMLTNRSYIVEKVRPMLIEGMDIYTLPGMKKPSLGKPGAEKLAAIFGLTAKFEVDKETMQAIGERANDKQYIAYICNLMRAGRAVGQGRGATFIEWQRNSYQMVFSQPSGTPESNGWKGPFNGTSKSSGKPYIFWKVPEAPVFDPLALNKAIKMAQKSAFVDAVIRATGMSDLFTQDLEDAGTDPAPAAPEAEPFPGTPAYQQPPQGEQTISQDSRVETGDAPICELCNAPMKRRNGMHGPFWGCSNYPKCTNIKKV